MAFYGEKKPLAPTSALALVETICWMVAMALVGAGGRKLTEIVGFRPNLVLKGNKGAHKQGEKCCFCLRGGPGAVCMKEADVCLGFIRFNLYQTWNT